MRRGIGIVVMMIVFCSIPRSGYARWTGICGWHQGGDSKPVFFDGVSGHEGTVEGADINGEVGHVLDVDGPMNVGPGGCAWTSNYAIVSGTLPPGLSIVKDRNYYFWHITGIPTERGHWVVEIQLSNIQCDGETYMGFTQQLRFHITGTGKVIAK